MWFDVDPKNEYHNAMCLKEIGFWASKYDNRSRVTNQHNWGNLYNKHKNYHFDSFLSRAPIFELVCGLMWIQEWIS